LVSVSEIAGLRPINLSDNPEKDFSKDVKAESGQDVSRCYQCGNCTAGCPYTQFFDFPVSQIMRLIQANQKETVLNSRAIWLCATCETCTTRCPCEVEVAHIMDTLRIMARREKRVSEKDVKTFYDSFLTSLKNHGRIFEVEILMRYNLSSGHLLADADLGPKVLTHGQLHLLPQRIKGRSEVARIFNKFAEKRTKRG
jgi:heterodisulfide reductase subunit C